MRTMRLELSVAAGLVVGLAAGSAAAGPELISANAAGIDSASAQSINPLVSDDGRFVAFVSDASDLGPTDGNGTTDVYVHDRSSGITTLVSANAAGTGTGNGTSDIAWLTGDGRFVYFISLATDLVAATDNDGAYDLFVRDL